MASRCKVGVKRTEGNGQPEGAGKRTGNLPDLETEKGHAALVVKGKFASADAEGLGAVLQELVRSRML